MRTITILVLLALILMTGCQLVPSTGDKSTDVEAAQNYVPESIPGYNASDATNIADALSKAGASISLLSGNVALTAAIAKLDNMITCYKDVGAVAAKVYTEQNITGTGIPKIGALAVINTTRIQNNFVQCAVNIVNAPSAQAVGGVEPCGSSGEITVNNEKIAYVYGATTPELCSIFQSRFN